MTGTEQTTSRLSEQGNEFSQLRCAYGTSPPSDTNLTRKVRQRKISA